MRLNDPPEEMLDSRAASPAPPLPNGSLAPEQPDSLLHPDRPRLLPHPLMLDPADVYGTLKPEFQEYEVYSRADGYPIDPG